MGTIGATINIVNLVKTFEEIRAVDGISLNVESGEFLTLLGPSGSGKTTTLNLIAGFDIPTSGEILLGGEDIAIKPPHRRNLGMVFQNYALFPHMTVFENVAFPLRNRKSRGLDIRESVGEALSLVKLEGYEKRYPKQLSGGQQQRVAIARSLVYSPRALLMDEPLGALDKKLREYMQIEIKRIQKDTGITVIYVTHDQEEALNMSDRIAVMNQGKIEQVGSPREVYEKPKNRFIADFIGDANIIEGHVSRMEEETATVTTLSKIQVKAFNLNRRAVHSSVHLVIRPERVKLLKEEIAADNCFMGTVSEASYVGNMIRYLLDLDGGERILLKEPNGGQGIEIPGRKVRVGWNWQDALIV